MKCSLIFYVIGIFSHSGKMTSLIKPGPAPGWERWLSDHLRDIQLGHGTFFVAPLIASDFPSIIIIQFSAGVLPAAEHRSRRLLATSLLIRPVLTSAYHIQPSGELFRPTAGFRLPTTIRQTAQPSTEGSYSPLPAIGREQLLSAPGSRLAAPGSLPRDSRPRNSRLSDSRLPGSRLPDSRLPGIAGFRLPATIQRAAQCRLRASDYRQPSEAGPLPATDHRDDTNECKSRLSSMALDRRPCSKANTVNHLYCWKWQPVWKQFSDRDNIFTKCSWENGNQCCRTERRANFIVSSNM